MKKLGLALLFPHIAVIFALIPLSAVFLVYSLLFLTDDVILSSLSYATAFYTLTVSCIRIPSAVKFFKSFGKENRFISRWTSDTHLRINVSLSASLVWNSAYALLQLGLGIRYRDLWFYSLSLYYAALAVMRFFLFGHTRKNKPGENTETEIRKYRACGILLLLMNISISCMIFYMVSGNKIFHHHEITTIAMATYTFASFSLAVVNLVKYRKYNSPVYSASKAISLVSACVSLLTLESTMLTTFGGSDMTQTSKQMMLGLTGAAVSIFIIVMAVYMIITSNKKTEDNSNG